jgi:hypothetical protein
VCLIALEFWAYHSLINNHHWLSKIFDSYSVTSIISSIIPSILISSTQTPNPTFPESRDEIPFKGGSLSHPQILISECEPFFPQETQNFQKNSFILTKSEPFWMNVERREFFWITLSGNVSQLKWIILKEPFEDWKYLGCHYHPPMRKLPFPEAKPNGTAYG